MLSEWSKYSERNKKKIISIRVIKVTPIRYSHLIITIISIN